jgi:hypothetical protein
MAAALDQGRGCSKIDGESRAKGDQMRIRLETPQSLVLEDKPWLLGIVLSVVILGMLFFAFVSGRESLAAGFGLVFGAAIFGGAFVVFVRQTIVIFDREAAAVVIRSRGVLGQSERTLALADIAGAAVETQVSRSGSRNGRRSVPSHRPVLLLHQGGAVPLRSVYVSGGAAQTAADAVNQWL